MSERVKTMLMAGLHPAEVGEITRELSDVLVTAHEVAPERHVRIQAGFQANVDNAVSKTVNLPAEATVKDVDRVFRLAFDLGCKGVTVYRDGSRQNQILSAVGNRLESGGRGAEPRPRPRVAHGNTTKFRMGCGTLFVTVNM